MSKVLQSYHTFTIRSSPGLEYSVTTPNISVTFFCFHFVETFIELTSYELMISLLKSPHSHYRSGCKHSALFLSCNHHTSFFSVNNLPFTSSTYVCLLHMLSPSHLYHLYWKLFLISLLYHLSTEQTHHYIKGFTEKIIKQTKLLYFGSHLEPSSSL